MDIIFQAGTATRTGCRISVPLDTDQGIPTVNGIPPQASAVMDTIRRRPKVNGMPPQALGAMSAVQPLSRANGINSGFQKSCMELGIPTWTRKSIFLMALIVCFWHKADIGRNLASYGLSANDPTATLAVHCGNGFDVGFSPYQSTRLSR